MKGELKRDKMTADQQACFDLLAEVFGGAHHVPKAVEWGYGIKVNVGSGRLATFDFNFLTRLVVLAHDRCIRAEICQGGPRMVGVALWKRQREGGMNQRHPTLEDAVASIRLKSM